MMRNNLETSRNGSRIDFLTWGLVAAGIGIAGYVGLEACSSETGCVEGAREIWRGAAPDWLRAAVRGTIHFVLQPSFLVLVLVAVLAERFLPARRRQAVLSKGAVHDAAAWFVLDKLMFGLLVGMVFSYTAAVSLYQEHLSFLTIESMANLPMGVRLVLAFFFVDFLNWFHHLVRHKVRAFWVFHAVHHSQRDMNLFTDDRIHPIDRVIAMPLVLVPTMMFQLNLPAIPWLIVAERLYTHFYHANVQTDYGPLRYLFVTPQSHRIHHSEHPEHADKNFGVVFCIWDRIFGTHLDAVDEYPQTGIQDPDFPMEESMTPAGILSAYVRQFFYPFVQIWRRITTGRWELPAG